MDFPKDYQFRSPEKRQATSTPLPVVVRFDATVGVGDAIKHIFTFLPPNFLFKKIPFLSRRFNVLSRDDQVWKKVLQKNYPHLVVDSVPSDPNLSWRDEFVKYLRLRKVCIKHLYTKHVWKPPMPIQNNDIGYVSSKEPTLVFYSYVQDKGKVVFLNPTTGTILRTIECGKSISSFEFKRNKLVLGDSQNNQFICHEFNDHYKFPIDDVKNVNVWIMIPRPRPLF